MLTEGFVVLMTAATLTGPPSGFVRGTALEPAASFVAGKPVKVWCAVSAAQWRLALSEAGHTDAAHGLAAVGSNELRLSPDTCSPLLMAVRGGAVYQPLLADTIQVLTHESIHTRGVSDEGVTDCDAMHEMPRVAVRFFRVTPYKQLRAVMTAAWAYHRQEPAPYLTVC